MQISWVLLAENIVVKEHSQRMDIIGEFRSVLADNFPYPLPKFYIVCRIEGDVSESIAAPYKLTLRRPSDEFVELYSSSVSVEVPPNVGRAVGNLIAEIQDFDILDQGRHTLIAQLGENTFSTDLMVVPMRNVQDDTQK